MPYIYTGRFNSIKEGWYDLAILNQGTKKCVIWPNRVESGFKKVSGYGRVMHTRWSLLGAGLIQIQFVVYPMFGFT